MAGRVIASRPRMDDHMERVIGLVHSCQISDGRPDLQILFQDNPVVGPNQIGPKHGFSIRTSLMRPRGRGEVRLVSTDPADPPRLAPNYYADPRDVAATSEGLEMALPQPPRRNLPHGGPTAVRSGGVA